MWVTANGLTLHPTKTPGPKGQKGGAAALCACGAGVGDCRIPGQGFEFVTPKACFQHDGYRFEAGKRPTLARLRRGVRKKSTLPKARQREAKLKDKIREKTGRCRGVSLEQVIADLNPVLRGWFGYFKQAHPTTFADVDGFIRRRLRSMLLKQKNKRHIGFGTLIHKTWPNAYFANLGLFALKAAWDTARQSR